MSQSHVPSPSASTFSRIAAASLTVRETARSVEAPSRVRLSTVPVVNVIVTSPNGTSTEYRPWASVVAT